VVRGGSSTGKTCAALEGRQRAAGGHDTNAASVPVLKTVTLTASEKRHADYGACLHGAEPVNIRDMSVPQPEARRRGRPRKPGPRRRLHVELRLDLFDLLRQEAAAGHKSLGDQLTEILSAYYADGITETKALDNSESSFLSPERRQRGTDVAYLRRTYRDGARSRTRPSPTCPRCRTTSSTSSTPASKDTSSPGRRRGRPHPVTAPEVGWVRLVKLSVSGRSDEAAQDDGRDSGKDCYRDRMCREMPTLYASR
jgi:hypothetical protein